jgi:flagellar hook assembly protein FlgD
VTGQPDDQPKIKSFSLANAYPNPAGKQVNLSYQLPAPANVRLNIYNIAGQMVKCFDQGRQSAGAYSIRYNTAALPNGIYFYQIDAGAFKATKRMMVIR